jgi:hypothetical protein
MATLHVLDRTVGLPRYDIPAIFEAAPFTKRFFDRLLAGPFFTDQASVASGRDIMIGIVGVGARRVDPTLSAVVLREAVHTDDNIAALGTTVLAIVEESGLASGYAVSMLGPAASAVRAQTRAPRPATGRRKSRRG